MWTLNTIGVQASKLLQLMFIIHYYEEWLHLPQWNVRMKFQTYFGQTSMRSCKTVSGVQDLMFNPIGWMEDEAGTNWAGLREVFGSSVISRTISCQFQCQQACSETQSQIEFKQLARGLIKSDTLSGSYKGMQVLITTKPHKCGFLKTWLAWLPWWYVRRFHVFNAFRATDSTPTTNLAESVHASWANTQATNITLLEAAYHDISESIRLEQQLKAFSEGIYKEGTGPSAIHVEQQK